MRRTTTVGRRAAPLERGNPSLVRVGEREEARTGIPEDLEKSIETRPAESDSKPGPKPEISSGSVPISRRTIGQRYVPSNKINDKFINPHEISKERKKEIFATAQQIIQSLPVLVPEGFKIGLYKEEVLSRESVVSVMNNEKSGLNSVNDARMGVVENNRPCETCKQDNLNCPGHKGMLNLNSPIFHPDVIPHIIMVLNCVCNSCGNLFFSESELRKGGILRYARINRLRRIEILALQLEQDKSCCRKKHGSKILPCKPNPCFDGKNSDYGQIMQRPRKGKKCDKNVVPTPISVQAVYKILHSVSDEDAILMGFENGDHPRQMITKKLPIIPPGSRQPAFVNEQVRPNDITTAYLMMIKMNMRMRDILRSEEKDIKGKTKESRLSDAERRMFLYYSHLIDNSDGTFGATRGRVLNSIKKLLQGKDSMMRGLLMGKKVNFVVRTVAGPDPLLRFGQVGIPRIIMREQTKPEKVTRYNRAHILRDWSKQDSPILFITTRDNPGLRKRVSERMIKKYKPNIGDIVERQMMEGDVVLVNRQPTLQKQGLNGQTTHEIPGKVVRIHMSDTTPKNADFDGDEMSAHNIQTTDAVVEAQTFAHITNNIINPQTNRPIIAAVYDMIDGTYKLTQETVRIPVEDKKVYLRLLTARDQLESLDSRLQELGVNPLSGRALFSSLLPVDFYYSKGEVEIRKGVLIKGVIAKEHIGTTHGSIVQKLCKYYGNKRASKFLTDLPYLVNHWFATIGFSVGLEDCILHDSKLRDLANNAITVASLTIESLGPKPEDKLEQEVYEKKIRAALDKVTAQITSKINSTLPKNNAFNVMTSSQAKGSGFNVQQIMVYMGQQWWMAVDRHPLTISGKTRVLPHFSRNDPRIEARGFVRHNFLQGQNPGDYYFAAAGGREGLMDTALKTAETGYLHRRISKVLEDIQTATDCSVRNANQSIFQVIYGEDGLDASCLENVTSEGVTSPFFINPDYTGKMLDGLLI